MLIGLLSDSHNIRPNVRYALEIFRTLGIQTVFHAGDLISIEMLDEFAEFSLHLSFGNGDDPSEIVSKAEGMPIKPDCGEAIEMTLSGKRFFMMHGDRKAELEQRIQSGDYDYVIHGHTHRYRDETIELTRVINPGALGGRFMGRRSFATLDPAKNELQRYYLP